MKQVLMKSFYYCFLISKRFYLSKIITANIFLCRIYYLSTERKQQQHFAKMIVDAIRFQLYFRHTKISALRFVSFRFDKQRSGGIH